MRLEAVPIEGLYSPGGLFSLGPIGDLSGLKASIAEVGVINPPLLRRVGEAYEVVSGRRRIAALKELGVKRVDARVFEEGELSDLQGLKLLFYENEHRVLDMEKAEFLAKFRAAARMSDAELISFALPLLKIRPSRKSLARYTALSELDSDTKGACYDGTITIDQAFLLSEIEPSMRALLLNALVVPYGFNTNETRELIRELPEAAAITGKPVPRLLEEIVAGVKGKGGERKKGIRRGIKRMRYPRLTRAEEGFDALLRGMSLPKGAHFSHPPYFEGNYLDIGIKAESEERIKEFAAALSKGLEDGTIRALFSLIKTGGVEWEEEGD